MKNLVMVKERNVFFDSLKFFLIALVILGHLIEVNVRGRFETALYNMIYTFHMPLFIFVSGYFTKRYDNDKVFLIKTLRLIETYVVFQLLFSLLSLFQNSITATMLYRPWWILWYLFSLIIWRTLIKFAPSKLLLSNWQLSLCLSVAMSLLGGFVPLGYEFSFQRTCTFFPFFVMGYICSKVKTSHIDRFLPPKLMSIFYFTIIFVALVAVNKSFSSILYGSFYYTSIYGLVGRFLQIVLGVFGGLCFMGLINGIKVPSSYVKIGSNTLFFFIYHAFFIVGIKLLVSHYEISLGIGHLIIVYFLTMTILYVLCNIHFLHYLLNPISSTYNTNNSTCRRS